VATYILVNDAGMIVNCVTWDGTTNWMPPDNLSAIAYALPCGPGWMWDGTKAVAPPDAAPAPKRTTSNPSKLTVI
jgi:hypothetical protein